MDLVTLCSSVIRATEALQHAHIPQTGTKVGGRKAYLKVATGEDFRLHVEVDRQKLKLTIHLKTARFEAKASISKHMNVYNYHGPVPPFWSDLHQLLKGYRG